MRKVPTGYLSVRRASGLVQTAFEESVGSWRRWAVMLRQGWMTICRDGRPVALPCAVSCSSARLAHGR